MKAFRESAYSPIIQNQTDDTHTLNSITDAKNRIPNTSCNVRKTHFYCLTLANLILFATSVIILTTWVLENYSRNSVLRKSSFFSPIFAQLTIPISTKITNGSHSPPPENPSIGRALPNPEADALWDEIELTRTIRMSADDVRRLGKDVDTAARSEDEHWGFGEGVFMGQIDVFHQLHCLNSLRKLAYPKYYAPNEKCDEHDEMWYIHINHCVDILLQNLMCSSNVDIITVNWMETQKYPFPDFSINHECRDFDTILRWRKENSVDMNMWDNMVKPKGVKELKLPKEYFEVFSSNGTKEKANHKDG